MYPDRIGVGKYGDVDVDVDSKGIRRNARWLKNRYANKACSWDLNVVCFSDKAPQASVVSIETKMGTKVL